MKALLAILALVLLAGCSTLKEPATYAGIAGDGITTYIAIANPDKFAELNPLQLATIPLSILAVEYAEKMPRNEGLPVLHSIRSVKWAGFVNNLLIFAGLMPAVTVPAGLAVGYYLWHMGADERAYANWCAGWIAEKPGNTCKPYRS